MATRVFELARELGVRSKDVLEKCRAEGLEIKNHMATLSIGLEATIREWFSEAAPSESTAVETAEHVDVKKARAKAARTRRKKKAAEEAPKEAAEGAEGEAGETPSTPVAVAEVETAEGAETEAEAPEAPTETAPAEVEAQTAPPAVVSEAPHTVEESAVEKPAAEVAEPAEAPTPVEQPEAPAEAEKAEEPKAPEAPPAVAAEAEKPAEEAPEAEEPEEEAEEEDEDVKPAGPQVVPKPATLKGPRVVRVEKPDYVPAPRRGGPPRRGGRGTAPPEDTGPSEGPRRGRMRPAAAPGGGRKTRRRSPRRRSGQVADTGDRIREWRDADLAERSQRLAAASGGHRRHRPSVSGGRKAGTTTPKSGGKVEVEEPITVKSLSAATGLKTAEIIRKLMGLGVMATVNQTIDTDMAEAVVVDYDIELEVRRAKTAEEEVLEELEKRPEAERAARAPVVTFLGHVDHGKTSLLDYIRRTTVAEGEAGGITQHMGAYRYDEGGKHVVFLDTPGHEAFTAMRARGANMTDVVVLVVAADDGVMPQTVEAINHAKAAEVPIVVALNKIDVPNANVQRALGQLAEHGLQPQEWGGETEVIHTSAETGEGVDTLVETLSLEAELLELKAEVDAPATGYVIESEMKQGLGPVARLLVRNGTLRIGDVLLAGMGYGRVRVMTDSLGRQIEEAGPATPVEVSGLDEVCEAGDRFYVVESIDQARAAAEDRRNRQRQKSLAGTQQVTLEGLFSKIKEGQANELPVIIKADVQGSVEALVGSLDKLSTDEVRLNILHTGVGGISTGDVTLAEASEAIIIGFNVVANAAARQAAEAAGVDIRLYRVIYEIIEDIRGLMEQGLAPEVREETLGRAQVRQVFRVSHVGTVAGCYVTDGVVQRNSSVRITRNDVVVEDGRSLDSLKRFKDDVREVRNGMECGVKIAGYDDVKEGDILEFYRQVEVARKL